MILVDTSVWIDYFNGKACWQTDYLDGALSNDTILTGDIILCEILQGFHTNKEFNTAKNALDVLECVPIGGKQLAIQAANNFSYLRKKGITIRKTVDILIGTWCIESGISLLHNDKDFNQMAKHLPLGVIKNSE